MVEHESLASLVIISNLTDEIKKAQLEDKGMMKLRARINEGKLKCFQLDDQGILWFGKRLVVPKNFELRKKILDETHESQFSIHTGSNKMYQDLKKKFWWTRMKREIASYVAECDVCQRVKAEHLKPAGTLQPLPIFLGSGRIYPWILLPGFLVLSMDTMLFGSLWIDSQNPLTFFR